MWCTIKEIESMRSKMVGTMYRHFKGGVYLVTDIAVHTETGEIVVIYKDAIDSSKVWCRPLDMFLSNVDTDKYPAYVYQTKRFTPICDGMRSEHIEHTSYPNSNIAKLEQMLKDKLS